MQFRTNVEALQNTTMTVAGVVVVVKGGVAEVTDPAAIEKLQKIPSFGGKVDRTPDPVARQSPPRRTPVAKPTDPSTALTEDENFFPEVTDKHWLYLTNVGYDFKTRVVAAKFVASLEPHQKEAFFADYEKSVTAKPAAKAPPKQDPKDESRVENGFLKLQKGSAIGPPKTVPTSLQKPAPAKAPQKASGKAEKAAPAKKKSRG